MLTWQDFGGRPEPGAVPLTPELLPIEAPVCSLRQDFGGRPDPGAVPPDPELLPIGALVCSLRQDFSSWARTARSRRGVDGGADVVVLQRPPYTSPDGGDGDGRLDPWAAGGGPLPPVRRRPCATGWPCGC